MAVKIVFLVSSMQGGGAERVAALLCNRWVANGHDVVLVPTFSGRGECRYHLDERVRTEYLADRLSRRINLLQTALCRLVALRSFIVRENPDIVISFLPRVNIAAILSTMGVKTRVIVSERNDLNHDPVGSVVHWLRKLLYGLTEVVVVQTGENARWVKRNCLWKPNVAVIPNPIKVPLPIVEPVVEPNAWVGQTHQMVLAVGRLVEQKNFECLIQAFTKVAQRCEKVHLVILGEGPLREELQAKVDMSGFGDRIHLPGRVGNVGDWYERADIYVMSSLYEGFPNTLMEALAYGLPSISFECGSGTKELLHDRVNGLLVAREKGSEGMAEAIFFLISDGRCRNAMSKEAQKVVTRFSVESIDSKWSRIIEMGVH